MSTQFEQVHAIVAQIPPGKVVTYGQIAQWLGWTHGARTVGWALRAAPAGLPWHRVVNAQGRISLDADDEQRLRLEAEGVTFSPTGRVDLNTYRFTGPIALEH